MPQDTMRNQPSRGTHYRIIAMALLVALLLAACQPAASQPTAAPEADQTTAEAPIAPTPTLEIKPETPVVCTENGVTERFQFDSALMNTAQYLTVYFPPCYDAAREPGYPVVYLLHGQTFDDNMWIDLGAARLADDLILSGQAQPFLMVFPFEEFFYRASRQTKFPQALTDEIIPFVEETFNACPKRACRALGGISRGASFAMRLGMKRYDLFAALGGHSLPTFQGDVNELPLWLKKIPKGEMPRLYIDIGRLDPEIKNAREFQHILNESGILHEWQLNEGRHDTEYWQAHISDYLRWYAQGWD